MGRVRGTVGIGRARTTALATLLALGVACSGESSGPPTLVAITPDRVTSLAPTAAVISGDNLYAAVVVELGSDDPSLNQQWRVSIGAQAMADETVVRLDAQSLAVTVPAGLPVGAHDVIALSPRGDVLTLPRALTVTADPIGLALSIEDSSDGSGDTIGDTTITAGETLSLQAIIRDADGAFLSSRVAVDWRIVGTSPTVAILSSAHGASAEFLARHSGSVRVVAEHPDTGAAMTGTITVVAGAATTLSIEDAAGGTGTLIGDRTLTTDDSLTLHAITRDAFGNFVGAVEASWSQTAPIGSFSIDTGRSTDLSFSTPGGAEVIADHALGQARTGLLSVSAGRAVTLTINPQTLAVTAGDAPINFTLTATDADGHATTDLGTVTWSVTEGTIGLLDTTTGILTPTAVGVGRISAATSHGATVETGLISIAPGPAATLMITIGNATFTAGDAASMLTVTATDAFGNATNDLGTLTWSVASGSIGVLDPTGVLTPQAAGSGTIRVVSSHGSNAVSGPLTINAGIATALTVSPDSATLTADDAPLQLTVTGTDAFGNATTDLGTITWSTTGTFTAINPTTGILDPTRVGSGTVVATSSYGPTDAGGNITITPGRAAVLAVAPNTLTINADDTPVNFSVTATDADGNATSDVGTITWTTTGAITAIDPTSGVLDPTRVGNGSVVAASSYGPTDASGTITITPGRVATLTVAPNTLTTTPTAGPTTFTVSGIDADGNATTNLGTITWSTTGTITSINPTTGVFMPTTAGSGAVRAVSSLGPSANSSTVNVNFGAATTITIVPNTLSLSADAATTAFSVTATDAGGNPTTDVGTLTWSIATGAITSIDSTTGVLTPTVAGSGTVRVVSSYGLSDDSGTITITPGRATVLTVAPDTLALNADDAPVTFTVSARDADGNATTDRGTITWSTVGPITAINSNTGVLTPRIAGSGSVRATSSYGVSDDSGTITIAPGRVTVLTVAPNTLTTMPGQSPTAFTVSATDADGNATTNMGVITWSTTGPITSINSASGLFTPTTVGTGAVRAISSLGPSANSGAVIVNAGPATTITVVPDTLTVSADAAATTFTVTATDAGGNSTTNVGTLTWSIASGPITSLSSSGVLTPTVAGSGTVRAVSSLGPSDVSGTITITPGRATVLTVAPDTLRVNADAPTTTFTVSGTDQDGNVTTDLGVIAWSISSGPITAIHPVTGVFTPTLAGVGSVRATSSYGTFDDSGSLTIDPGRVSVLTVAPDTLTTRINDPVTTFSATGVDSDGNATPDLGTISWSTTGPITAIGALTGVLTPATAGTGNVRATSSYGPADLSGNIIINSLTPVITVAAVATPASVVRGQRNIRVDVDLYNSSSLPALLTSVSLTVQNSTGTSVSGNYTVVADYRNANAIDPGATATLIYYVTASLAATPGAISIIATLEAYFAGFGFVTSSRSGQWTIVNGTLPRAAISKPVRPTNRVCVNGTVAFEGNNSIGAPLTYAWTFNSGSPSTSAQMDPPSITYGTVGSFPYALTVTDNFAREDTALSTELIHVGRVEFLAADTFPTGTVWIDAPSEGDAIQISDLPNNDSITMSDSSDKNLTQCDGSDVASAANRYVTLWVDRGVIDPAEDDRPLIPGIQINLDQNNDSFNSLNFVNASPALEGPAIVYGEYFNATLGVVTASGFRNWVMTDDRQAPTVLAALPTTDCGNNCWGKTQPLVFHFNELMNATRLLADTRVEVDSLGLLGCASIIWSNITGSSTLTYDMITRTLRVWPAVQGGSSYTIRVRIPTTVTDASSNANPLPSTYTRCIGVYNAPVPAVPATPVLVSSTPIVFSPDGDGSTDTADIQLTVDSSTRLVELRITAGPTAVRTLTQVVTGPTTTTMKWDGRDLSGRMVPNGYFRFALTAINASGVSSTALEGAIEAASAVRFVGVPPRY